MKINILKYYSIFIIISIISALLNGVITKLFLFLPVAISSFFISKKAEIDLKKKELVLPIIFSLFIIILTTVTFNESLIVYDSDTSWWFQLSAHMACNQTESIAHAIWPDFYKESIDVYHFSELWICGTIWKILNIPIPYVYFTLFGISLFFFTLVVSSISKRNSIWSIILVIGGLIFSFNPFSKEFYNHVNLITFSFYKFILIVPLILMAFEHWDRSDNIVGLLYLSIGVAIQPTIIFLLPPYLLIKINNWRNLKFVFINLIITAICLLYLYSNSNKGLGLNTNIFSLLFTLKQFIYHHFTICLFFIVIIMYFYFTERKQQSINLLIILAFLIGCYILLIDPNKYQMFFPFMILGIFYLVLKAASSIQIISVFLLFASLGFYSMNSDNIVAINRGYSKEYIDKLKTKIKDSSNYYIIRNKSLAKMNSSPLVSSVYPPIVVINPILKGVTLNYDEVRLWSENSRTQVIQNNQTPLEIFILNGGTMEQFKRFYRIRYAIVQKGASPLSNYLASNSFHLLFTDAKSGDQFYEIF